MHSRSSHRAARALLALSAVAGLASPALAAPEEIQVYMDELGKPGELGLDIHNNYVVGGDSINDYPGHQQSLHRYRVTPEFALGLTNNLELGVYLPLATIDGTGRASVDGFKFRLKYILPRRLGQKWFLGGNFEIGRVGRKLDENPYNAELKGIAGIRSGRWTAALNTNFDFTVSGPNPGPASIELATKVNYAITPKFALGIENFTGVGEVRRLGRFGTSDQSTFVTVDTAVRGWDLNLGIGSGYGSNPDHLLLKAVVGVPIGH